jgi:long-chain acyl-CoA synthetase
MRMQPPLTSDALRRAELLFPRKTATVDGSSKMSYAELAGRCRRLAGALSGLGVAAGDRVAVLMANGSRYLECLFAVPGMGAVVVPLNTRSAVPEFEYIIDDAGVKVLIVDQTNASTGHQLASRVERLLVAPDEYEDILATAPALPLGGHCTEDDIAGLFYTGGTTGVAKGVMLSHRNLMSNASHVTIALGHTERDVYLHCAPMFHLADGASTFALTWVGGTHVFVPAFEPGHVLETIARERVTHTLMVPTMLAAANVHPAAARADLSSMRALVHAAAPMATELLQSSIRTFGCSFSQGYGMTEAAPGLTMLRQEERLIGDPRLRSVGRETVGVEVEVRRPDGSHCDPGEVGEVVARGPNIMLGYWNKPHVTAAALRDGWYWTQDLGYLDEDRYLFLVDRAKDMIISGGENVYSTEVEEAIMSHPAVLECAVIGLPDDHWGERVHAAVVLKPGQILNEGTLVAHCRERISGYKCPRTVELVGELPKSGAGKILKRALRDRRERTG